MTGENKVTRAAGLLMLAMIISRILGYIRDVVIYAQFGQNRVTDAYQAAFSIPDFLYLILVGGAMSSAFIPVFSGYIARDENEEAWEVANSVLTVIIALMLVGIILGTIFTRELVYLLVPGFAGESVELTVTLTRIMFAQAFFMALSGITMGILNSFKHFWAPAVGSVMYNLGIIIVGVLLSPKLGIAGFSVGVVAGAVANFGVQLPVLIKKGFRYRPRFNIFHPGVIRIGVLMFPVLIGLSVTQFNLFVSQNLASTLPEGMVAALRTAQRLMQLPVGIFAVAIGVAVFPTLTGHAAKREMKQFKRSMSLGIRSVLFITLPASAGLLVLRVPLVRLLFQQGWFTAQNTEATAIALLYYSLGLIGYSAIQVLNRVFYALQDTRTPVVIGIVTIALNIGLSFALIGLMGHGGLALAYSVAGIVNMLLLMIIARAKIGGIDGRRIVLSFGKSFLASILMGLVVYFVAAWFELNLDMAVKANQAWQVIAAALAGAVVYAGLVIGLKMEEARLVLEIFRRRFVRGSGVAKQTP